MKIKDTGTRILGNERGFTLVEMLVTMVIMVVVLFALHNIFDTSIKIFSFGNDKVEAVENARLGLEKMEREIRGAYPVDRANSQKHLFFNTSSPATGAVPSSGQLTFGNELGTGDARITCVTAPCEYITYKLTDDASGAACTVTVAPCTLRRANTANSAEIGAPVVEFVQANGLTFTYLKSTNPDVTAATEAEINVVRIRLQIRVEGTLPRTQTLTTDVDLRNRI